MIIARIESLILGKRIGRRHNKGQSLYRCGVDGIMIHSKAKNADEILAFSLLYAEFSHKVPLVAVPTAYNDIYVDELQKAGVNIVIYANHLLRSAYPAMRNTALSILQHGRSEEIEKQLFPIEDLLKLTHDKL